MKKPTLALLFSLVATTLFAGRPVAKWDVVPYQRLTGPFTAGVVAFHQKALSVAFTVNGKDELTAAAPEFNARTKVWEYVLPIDPAKYPDGELRLGATVRTADGEQTVLPEILLYADSGKTMGSRRAAWVDPVNGNEFAAGTKEAPVKSIRQGLKKAGDGGYVLLNPGTYTAKMIGGGIDRRFWSVVTPAPGVKRSEVRIASGRPGTDKLRFRNVELFCDCGEGYAAIVMGEGGDASIWFDNCRFSNLQGRYGGSASPFGNKLRAYVTDGETEDMGCGPCCEFVRNHTVRRIAGDAFSCNDCLVVNSSVEDIDPGSTSTDSDVFNGFSIGTNWTHDVILYNVKTRDVKAKGLTGQRVRDSAFVNVSIGAIGGDLLLTRFSEEMENVLFAHVTIVDQDVQWMQTKNGRGDFKPTDVTLVNCLFRGMDGYDLANGGLTVKNCAFNNKDFYGRTTTVGDAAVVADRTFADEAAGRFVLPADAPAMTAGIELATVPADANGERYPAGKRPCGAFAR